MEKSDLLSTREAAQLLGISLRTAQLWVESGVLRAWKTAGGHRRILRASIDAVLAERRIAVGDASPPAPLSDERQRPFQMLVVEDEPDLLKLYRLTIASWDLPLQLVTASDGFEGLLRVGESHPDLLITDLNMPGIDGFRMISALASDPACANMELIAVTALGAGEIADRGGLPARVTVMTKPVPFDRLEQRVRAAVERHCATRMA
jgi:excisionase family DNA binding protein